MKLRRISRKIFIVRIIISIIIILVLIGFGIYFFFWGLTQHHFHEEPKNMLCDFTPEEQAEILDAFGLVIPDNEKNAYVYSFSYDYGVGIDGPNTRLIGYKTEIGGVEDYEGFYAANPDHKAFNETTLNFRTDRRYYIVYTDSVDTLMEKMLYEKYSSLYNRLSENRQ